MSPQAPQMQPNGVLLIDKPTGMTSHDVVARVRRVAHTRQVGHTGTLDPMASGLLIVCVGKATRISQWLVGLDKIYVGEATLGAISSTYDAEGDITKQDRPIPHTAQAIEQAMQRQLGQIIQLPPAYSAVKVQGKKLYEYARNGEPVPQKPRPVYIHHFTLLNYLEPRLQFEAKVGSGTYIRTMAHDLGLELGCGAYLSLLRRTRVGGFSVNDAVPLETLMAEPDLLWSRLLSLSEALGHLPKLTIHPRAQQGLLHGQAFTTRDILEFEGIVNVNQPLLVIDMNGQALSIVTAQPVDTETRMIHGTLDEEAPMPLGQTEMVFRPLRVLTSPC